MDWGGRGNGLYVALKWLVWFGCGEGCRCWGHLAKGAASKHCPGWWLETGRPTSSELLSPHPLVFRWEAASPPFLSPNSQPQTSWENCGWAWSGVGGRTLSEGRKGIPPFKPIVSSDFGCGSRTYPLRTGPESPAQDSRCPGQRLFFTVSGYPLPSFGFSLPPSEICIELSSADIC